MVKKDKTVIIVIGVAIAIIFLLSQQGGLKEAGPQGERVTRTVSPSSTVPGGEFTIRYTIGGASQPYGGIIYETIPSGYSVKQNSFNKQSLTGFDGQMNGQVFEIVLVGSINGGWGEYKLIAGSTSASLTNGRIEWGGSSAPPDVLPPSTLTVCSSQSTFSCNAGDVYWYDGCGTIESVKESCTPQPCTSYGASTCSGLSIEKTRTCYTSTCVTDACSQSSTVETLADTTAPNSNNGVCAWQCNAGACQQNTPADTGYDGAVNNQDLLSYIGLWISNSITNQDLLSAITAWVG